MAVVVENYICGQFETEAAAFIDSYEPAKGQVWAKIPDSDGDVVDRAVRAAKTAFPQWKALSTGKRAEYLLKAADLIEQRLEEFALAESRDQGKTLVRSRSIEIPRAILNLRAFASGQSHLLESANEIADAGVINYTRRTPVGVAGLIAPWNLPIYLLTFKIAPALMSGCTVVCKPSEMTSVTAWMLCKVFHEVGLPSGVLNLVCGYGKKAGEAIVNHPDVKVISFTGSTAVGKHIASVAAPMMKRMSLELGGKNPGVVFADARLDKAIPTLINAAFANQGEICLCTSRIYVQDTIYDEFVKRFVAAAEKLKVGDPADPDVFIGALVSRDHLDKVRGYARLAIEEGGVVHCGYGAASSPDMPGSFAGGYFFPPTVITGLQNDARCMQEEIFGPVVCLAKFSTEDEAVAKANDVPYGLCASVWSENVGIIHRMAAELDVGTVWENCWLIRSLDMPFGGTKMSGSGRESVYHSLDAFTDVKTVCIKIGRAF